MKPSIVGRFEKQSQLPMMTMLEITNRCNMDCPVCFADAGKKGYDLSLNDIRQRLDILLQHAGPSPLQISGGEPTLHEDLPEIIKIAHSLGFRNIELVTNGIKIGRNPEYLQQLVKCGLSAVYLQFDGLKASTHHAIRGQDMRETRMQAISSIRNTGVCCTLAIALIEGINDTEIGNIIRFGVENIDTVRAINFQAATRFQGRYINKDEQPAMPLSQLVSAIESQAHLEPDSFSSTILGHPECNAMSIVYVIDGKLVSLFNYLDMEKVMHYLGSDKRSKILELFTGKKRFLGKLLLDPKAWPLLLEAHSMFNTKRLNSLFQAKHLLLFAKSFMGCSTLNHHRLRQCNYGILQQDGIYSFCAFNNLHRFSEAENI